MEIINTLGIDVTLLLAQMLNFGILVVVLAFFVYKPLLRVIDERRDSISKSMADADKISRQREEMDKARRAELVKIEKEAVKLLDKAKAEVASAKEQMVTVARKEADDVLLRGKQQLQAEHARVTAELEKSAAALVIKLTGKLLEKEFTAADQDRLIGSLEHSLTAKHHAKK